RHRHPGLQQLAHKILRCRRAGLQGLRHSRRCRYNHHNPAEWEGGFVVFVGCSYSPWPVAGYRDAFREVMKVQNNITFEFADVKIENTWILDKVQKHIERCDLGLFDITFLNPNVLLELGIALGMKKRAHVFLNSTADAGSGLFSRIFASKGVMLPVNL